MNKSNFGIKDFYVPKNHTQFIPEQDGRLQYPINLVRSIIGSYFHGTIVDAEALERTIRNELYDFDGEILLDLFAKTMSYNDIAEEMGEPVRWVKWRGMYGLKQLRKPEIMRKYCVCIVEKDVCTYGSPDDCRQGKFYIR